MAHSLQHPQQWRDEPIENKSIYKAHQAMKKESMSLGTHPESTSSMLLRFLLYTAGILFFTASLPWLARVGDAAPFKENGMIEWLQFALLVAVSLLFARKTGASDRFPYAFTILACLAAFASAREMDANLDVVVPVLGWKIAYLSVIYAGFVFYKSGGNAVRQMRECCSTSGFFLLWAGFIVAIPFAQLVGNSAFLQAIMNEDYSRDYRRIIEEIGELMGYGLILVGTIELTVDRDEEADS